MQCIIKLSAVIKQKYYSKKENIVDLNVDIR